MKENTFLRTETTAGENGFSVRPYDGMPALFCRLDPSTSFYPEPLWYRNFEYREEEARGFPCYEDLFTPGVLEAPLLPGAEAFFMASLEEEKPSPKALWQGEVGRRKKQALETKGKKINLSPFLGGRGSF